MKGYLITLLLLSSILLAGCSTSKKVYTYEVICKGYTSQGFVFRNTDNEAMYDIMKEAKDMEKQCAIIYIKKGSKELFRSEVVQ